MIVFTAAVLVLLMGHAIRILRWTQFIKIYEQPERSILLRSLGIGYAVNFFIPFRAGDIVRAILSGKHLKNGFSFSFATIIVEYVLDIPFVLLIFSIFCIFSKDSMYVSEGFELYLLLTFSLFFISIILLLLRGFFKKAALYICSIFNQQIKFNLLFFLWSLLTSFKDIFVKIDKLKLIGYTLVMWAFYLLSYFSLAHYITSNGFEMTFADVFGSIFSGGGFNVATTPTPDFVAYILTSLAFLLAFSFLPQNIKAKISKINPTKYDKQLKLLPYVNDKDSLKFLIAYFKNEHIESLKKHMEANRDIHILQDLTAGSSATTLLCMSENKTFYRKYAFGIGAENLNKQIQWINEHKHLLPLPIILSWQNSDGFCSYDMEYRDTAIGLFNYLHSTSTNISWDIINNGLNLLEKTLYINKSKTTPDSVRNYIRSKINLNINKIEGAKELHDLLKYDTLIINGKEYYNLSILKKWLDEDFLFSVFCNDEISDIHGDLTIENIVYCNDYKEQYYLIDPNTGNIHNTPFLDYAKLLQSLHGGYEFFVQTANVSVRANEIVFLSAQSNSYSLVYQKYDDYLKSRFRIEQVKSIYFHEIVHWLRLMPHKIERDGRRAILFYAGLIKVMNDVINRFCEVEMDESKTCSF